MELFDSHFHLDQNISAEDYAEQAESAQVKYLMAVGGHYEESIETRKFANAVGNSWFSAGVHPHEASKYLNGIEAFAKFAEDPKMVAVGEIGLDYYYENSERGAQIKVFRAFLDWAETCRKPVIVHCRDRDGADDAYVETFQYLKEFKNRFVLHCYTGTVDWAEKFLELGGYLGITGIVTFPKAENVREVLRIIPEDRLLIETDSPYLAPVPYRGKKNCSAYLYEIAKFAAEAKHCSLEELASITTQNTFKLFNISIS